MNTARSYLAFERIVRYEARKKAILVDGYHKYHVAATAQLGHILSTAMLML
jgi:hypothetical protein